MNALDPYLLLPIKIQHNTEIGVLRIPIRAPIQLTLPSHLFNYNTPSSGVPSLLGLVPTENISSEIPLVLDSMHKFYWLRSTEYSGL